MKTLQGRDPVARAYDEAADVLYLSVGAPRPVVGIEMGDGVVLRYDEAAREVVGVTLIGLQAQLLCELTEQE